MIPLRRWTFVLISTGLAAAPPAARAAELVAVQGTVTVGQGGRAPRPARVGEVLAPGTRLRTGPRGRARLVFGDGTVAKVRPGSDLRVDEERAGRSGILVSVGRVWTRVVRALAGDRSFEVRTANAVAGVRGTRFEVGVGGDGSVRVLVEEGRVEVTARRPEPLSLDAGRMGEVGPRGEVGAAERLPEDPGWAAWARAHAFRLRKEGLQIAKSLRGRLDRRLKRLRDLLAEQRRLQEEIEALEAAPRSSGRRARIARAVEAMEEVSARIRGVKARSRLVLDVFERWAGGAGDEDARAARELSLMAADARRVVAGFADLAEEGLDGSEDSMERMMEEMRPLQDTLRDDEGADEELFDTP
jgi:hypothetical protein